MRHTEASSEPLTPRALKPPSKNGWVDFYDEKSIHRESFIYRRLTYDLAREMDQHQRRARIEQFKQHVTENGGRGEFLKFKWCLPSFLAAALYPDERADLEDWMSKRREKRNQRYVRALPHCTDEFGVGPEFLDATFSIAETPTISRHTRIFTMGSCFARNIAVFLQANGYNAEAFMQTEDLNSPFSNAQMLSVAVAEEELRNRYLDRWVRAIYGPPEAAVARHVERATARLDQVVKELKIAEVIIITIGNVLDFFIDRTEADFPVPGASVAPKFLLFPDQVELEKRTGLTNRLKTSGASFRMGTLSEARAAIASLYEAIRRVNPSALCIFTLSPVPIDNAIGLQEQLPYGALEIDCVSKSTLRVALHELMTEKLHTDPGFRYFPSYEIVRWIGPLLPEPAFGAEDAVSRHVSKDILNGIYSYFLQKFGKEDREARHE